jgi:hypothetical protein
MSGYKTTRHAARRLRGRAIPEAAIDLLFRFGASLMQVGAEVFYFDHAARRAVAAALPADAVRDVERWLDAYAVVASDGALITVGWRTRRLRRR